MTTFSNPVPKCWNTTNRTHMTYDNTVAIGIWRMQAGHAGKKVVKHLPCGTTHSDIRHRAFILRHLSEVEFQECPVCSQEGA